MAVMTPYEVAAAILACAYAGVDHTGDLSIARRCIVPGEIVWDDCQCGQLALSENRRYTSGAFPTEEIDKVPDCGNGFLVVDLTLSLTRCVPVGVNSQPPTCDQLDASAFQLMKDKADIRNAVDCCLVAIYDDIPKGLAAFQVGAQETVGPSGLCVGSETSILLGFLNPCGC